MKRILSTLIVVIAFVLLASGVQAAPVNETWVDVSVLGFNFDPGISGNTYGTPYVIGSEYLASLPPTTPIYIDFGSSTLMESPGDCSSTAPTLGPFGNILYSPNIPIGVGSTLELVTSANGALKGGRSYYLWNLGRSTANGGSIESNALFVAGGALVANMVWTSPATISATDFIRVRFQFTDDYAQFSIIPGLPSVEPGDTLVLTTSTAAPTVANRPIFAITPATLGLGMPGMTIQFGLGHDTSGEDLNGLQSKKATVIEAVNQMNTVYIGYPPSALMTPTTSVIDVNAGAGRLTFVPNSPTTALKSSAFQIQLVPAVATVNWGINICTANYTLTLADDTLENAITSVTIGTGTSPFTVMGTPPTGYITGWTSTGTAGNLLTAQTVTINVNGTTILNPGKFYVKLDLTPVSPVMPTYPALPFTLADTWVLNAMSIRIPYMLLDARTANNSGYVSFIELVNRSGDDVCVDLDANISDANSPALPTETPGVFALSHNSPNLTCAFTLAAHAVTIVQPTDIVGYFPGSLDNTRLWRVGLTLYVAAPQNSVDATAFQIAPDGNRTNVPVLYNLNTTTSSIGGIPVLNGIGRQWLQ